MIKNQSQFRLTSLKIWYSAWMLSASGKIRSKIKKKGNFNYMNKKHLVKQLGNTWLQVKLVFTI